MNLLTLLPTATLVTGAVLAVLLEVVGVSQGRRKVVARTHLPWLVGAAATLAAYAAARVFLRGAMDAVTCTAVLVIALAVAITYVSASHFLHSIDEERGELAAAYLLFGAGMCAAVSTTEPLTVAAGLTVATGAGVFLSAPDREGPHGIEASVRLATSFGLLLALLVLSAAFSALESPIASGAVRPLGVSAPLLLVVGVVIAGAAPLHSRGVDVGHGAASSATGLFTSTGLIVGCLMVLRLAERTVDMRGGVPTQALALPIGVLAVVTLVGMPLAALAQIRVGRLVAYLAAAQAGVPLVALASATAPPAHAAAFAAAVIGAVTGCAALLGVTLPHATRQQRGKTGPDLADRAPSSPPCSSTHSRHAPACRERLGSWRGWRWRGSPSSAGTFCWAWSASPASPLPRHR
jgi:NADH:ubiquinone oxidoreductase subunit 2 (subunit N)